jgi:hypothetical protein
MIHVKTDGVLPFVHYDNEHITILTMTKDGKQIKKIEDMMDSVQVRELIAKSMEYFQDPRNA